MGRKNYLQSWRLRISEQELTKNNLTQKIAIYYVERIITELKFKYFFSMLSNNCVKLFLN